MGFRFYIVKILGGILEVNISNWGGILGEFSVDLRVKNEGFI
jgi:hypothetical protein